MNDTWDVLDEPIGPDTTWTRVNVGEAIPGVPTPLTWTWTGPASDIGISQGWARMGVFTAAEAARQSDVDDRFVAISSGRALLNLDRLRAIGDRIPFNSGDKLESSLFSSHAHDGGSKPVRRRYPFVLAKLPVAVLRARSSVLGTVKETDAWWRDGIQQVLVDSDSARQLLRDSAGRYADLTSQQAICTVAGQGLFEALTSLCTRVGLPGAAGLLATSEQAAEVETVEDVWKLATGKLSVEAVLDRHGYHAATQGELAVPSWRMDPTPVIGLAKVYADRNEEDSPSAAQRRRLAERNSAEQDLLRRVTPAGRPGVKLLLRAVRAFVPLRETARMQFLQCFDVARAASWRLGGDLVDAGVLAGPEDAFYLTVEELTAGDRLDSGLVERRRERRTFYQTHEVPLRFTGRPEPVVRMVQDAVDRLDGLAGSPGIVVGRARVIDGPDDTNDLEEGEILVAETTSPSYASFFLLAAGVIVDIGGVLSHGAIVAREMGIPCVINTMTARHVIRTGDLIRVDGDQGVVEILERPSLAPAVGTAR